MYVSVYEGVFTTCTTCESDSAASPSCGQCTYMRNAYESVQTALHVAHHAHDAIVVSALKFAVKIVLLSRRFITMARDRVS